MSKKQKKKKTAASPKKTAQKTPEPKRTEANGILTFASAIIILLSMWSFAYGKESQNWLGLMGYNIGWLFSALFGLGSYIITVYVGWIGWRLMFSKSINKPAMKTLAIAGLTLSVCMLLSLTEELYPRVANWIGNTFFKQQWTHSLHYHLGGAPFFYLYKDLPDFNLSRVFNQFGVAIIFLSGMNASILYLSKIKPADILDALSGWYLDIKEHFAKSKINDNVEEEGLLRYVKLRTPNIAAIMQNTKTKETTELLQITPETVLKERPSLSRKEYSEHVRTVSDEIPETPFAGRIEEDPDPVSPRPPLPKHKKEPPKVRRERALTAQRIYNGDFEKYKTPPLNLLTTPKKVDQTSLKKDLRRQAEVLEETLMSFGIEAKVGQVNCGPTITSFEVHPAIGVKVQKIKTLENDIALNMEAQSIRIIAPIPGKAAVGIEVPNPQPQEVAFKDMLAAYKQSGKNFHIPILLGKTVSGDYVMNDLAKMPHCIIAGATGSGKSVCINTIVMSILMTARPDEIKLVMVDPKKVELTPYTNLPHMLAPVITEPQGACAALNWLVKEMEVRYEVLKRTGFRNIEAFNNRKADEEVESALGIDIPKKMPYIVGIIDELADLMMVASSDIETPIARIAQMARAVGIHLILATQRPSREVITGLIKANFPTRISFKVASRINSQIILDEVGSETLLGNGDMLFLPPGSHHLVRAQGAYIRDEDINATVEQICAQAPTNYVIKSFDNMADFTGMDGLDEPADSLYHDALKVIVTTGNASTTFLQRKLKIGYARAASLIDELEERGVVGPSEGSKARKILVSQGTDDIPEEEQLELLKLE